MTQDRETNGFFVHKFMVLLDLRVSELLIYALFYSYTVGTEGLFYASLDFISEQTGISRRTVNRAVQNMLSRGLIERCEINGRAGLRTVMSVAERLKRIYTANANELRKLTRSVQNRPKKAEENPSEVKPEDHEMPSDKKWRPANGRFWLPDVYTGKHYEAEPKYLLSAFGKDGRVKMTLEQYEKLKELIPDNVLKHYIGRLASIHIERAGRDELWRKCDYQIIRKWIDEDFKA